MHILFLKPIFKERIWGGNNLSKFFNLTLPSVNIGECWCITARKNDSSVILNGKYIGYSLYDLWLEKPYLFKNKENRPFPLLIKLLDASQPLSVQVHPNDHYANLYENDNGKNEFWYFINAEIDAHIILGTTASNAEQFKNLVDNKQWESLFKKFAVKKGDFISIPAGTVHGLGKGLFVYEVQQSSDVTYRIYDYDRVDSNGIKRTLNIDSASKVLNYNSKDYNEIFNQQCFMHNNIKKLYKNENFIITLLEICDHLVYKFEFNFLLCTVIEGVGLVNDVKVKKGDSFLIVETNEIVLHGTMNIFVTSESLK